MSHPNPQTLLGRWLDGDLDEAGAEALADHLKQSSEARRDLSRYEALEALTAALRPAPAPEGDLVARVMARIATRRPPRRPLGQRLVARLTASPLRLGLAGASAVALGLVVGLVVGRGTAPATDAVDARRPLVPVAPTGAPGAAALRHVDLAVPGPAVDAVRGGRAWVTFVFHDPGARSVAVAGSFNDWARTPMTRSDGAWHLTVPMKQGRQEYLFVVDGHRWVVDPAAPAVADDGFGGHNAVLQL